MNFLRSTKFNDFADFDFFVSDLAEVLLLIELGLAEAEGGSFGAAWLEEPA